MEGHLEDDASRRADGLLTSWKEIAERLGVTVRTAQSYEKSRGLPVRRMGSRVAILEGELRAWQLSHLARPAWWRRIGVRREGLFTVGGFLLAAVLWGCWHYWSVLKVGQPVHAAWRGSLLAAFDAKGRTVWQRQFQLRLMPLDGLPVDLEPECVDLDNDGQTETLFCYRHSKRETHGWQLECVSAAGQDLWRLEVNREVANARKGFRPPYVLREFAVFPSPENDKTWWTAAVFVHHVEYPSVVVVVDGKGKRRGELWHAGHLNSVDTLDLNGDGVSEILVAGVQHGAEQAVLHVLDPAHTQGQATMEPPESPVRFRNMTPGTEKTSVFFPRSKLNLKTSQFNFVGSADVIGNRIQITVIEHVPPPRGYLVYTLGRDFSVQNLAASVSYDNAMTLVELKREATALESEMELERLKRSVRVVHRR